MTKDDESILKSALAFVVLKRRLKAKQQGLSSSSLTSPSSSSLPYFTSTSSSQSLSKELKEQTGQDDGGKGEESRNGSHCLNDDGNTKTVFDPNEQLCVVHDSEEQEILPFLNGRLNNNGRRNRSKSNRISCPKHLETMLQVAKSTTLSLYSSKINKYFRSNNDDRVDHNQNDNHQQQEQHSQQPPSLSTTSSESTTATNIITSSSSSSSSTTTTTSSSTTTTSLDPSKNYSLIYDYKTASIQKIISSNYNHFSLSSYYHTYAVLDGILLHIASTFRSTSNTTSSTISSIRTLSTFSTTTTSYENKNEYFENHPSSYAIIFTFMIQNLLQPLVSITNSTSTTSTNNSSMINQQQQHIQNILSTCTILHRLVIFDTSLSFCCIIGICKILKFLYYNGGCGDCGEGTGMGTNHDSNSSENGDYCVNDDDDGIDCVVDGVKEEGQDEYSDIVNVLLDGYNKQERNDNDGGSPIHDINDNVEKCQSIQVQDVLTVNLIILLEQIIGMSILLLTDHNTARTTSATPNTNGQSKAGWIGDILSILNMHLGPELMIPVSTNDMARLYVSHECQSDVKNHYYKRSWNGDHRNGDDDHDVDKQKYKIVLHYGLNVGAKMMLRLFIYDIVQKLSFHNNA